MSSDLFYPVIDWGDIDSARWEYRMSIAQGEEGSITAVRCDRPDDAGETGECDRVPDDRAGRLVIRVAHAPDPGIAPGQDRVGFDLSDEPGDFDRCLSGRFDGGVWEIEEVWSRAEDLCSADTLRSPLLLDLGDWEFTIDLGHPPTCQPGQYDLITTIGVTGECTGAPDLIIGVRSYR